MSAEGTYNFERVSIQAVSKVPQDILLVPGFLRELLEQLRDAGVVPGAHGDFRFSEGYVLIQMDGKDDGLELPVELASHIFLVGEPA